MKDKTESVTIDNINRIEAIKKAHEDLEAGKITRSCYDAIFIYNAKKIWGDLFEAK